MIFTQWTEQSRCGGRDFNLTTIPRLGEVRGELKSPGRPLGGQSSLAACHPAVKNFRAQVSAGVESFFRWAQGRDVFRGDVGPGGVGPGQRGARRRRWAAAGRAFRASRGRHGFFLVSSSWLHREPIRGDVVLGRRRGTPSARSSRGPIGGAGERPRRAPAAVDAAGRNLLSTHFHLARFLPISAPTGVGMPGGRNEKSREWPLPVADGPRMPRRCSARSWLRYSADRGIRFNV
ncbi:MAG: hypothetical protein RL077_4409 [Verrucomicrobiota bacterium]